MEKAYTASIRVLAAVGLLLSAYFAATRTLGVTEAALWAHLVRPPLAETFRAPDAWTGLLYALVAERAIGILRLSEFSLRLPALLSGVVCSWLVWRSRNYWVAAAYLAAALLGWFSTACPYGLALAFFLLAVDRPRHAAWLFGLAIAASPIFALLSIHWWRIRDIERVVIPAVVTAFVLMIIPASQAGPANLQDARPDFYREIQRRNAARGGGFQPSSPAQK
jgi:hypothetical protein